MFLLMNPGTPNENVAVARVWNKMMSQEIELQLRKPVSTNRSSQTQESLFSINAFLCKANYQVTAVQVVSAELWIHISALQLYPLPLGFGKAFQEILKKIAKSVFYKGKLCRIKVLFFNKKKKHNSPKVPLAKNLKYVSCATKRGYTPYAVPAACYSR